MLGPGDYFFPLLDLAPPAYCPGQVCTRGPIPLGTGLLPAPPGPLFHVPALLWLLGSPAFPPVPTLLCFQLFIFKLQELPLHLGPSN